LPLVAGCIQEGDAKGADSDTKPGHLIPVLQGGFFDDRPTHALTGEGFDASEDGTGRGTPLVAAAMAFQTRGGSLDTNGEISGTIGQNCHSASGGAPMVFNPQAAGKQTTLGANTLSANTTQAVCFDTTQLTNPDNRSNPQEGDPCHPLAESAHPPAIAFNLRGREGGAMPEMTDVASVRSASGGSSKSYVQQVGVRRLTPMECERLQGFPDNWTEGFADGPRYKMLGNAVCVTCGEWLGKRINRAP
jgi:DNA (cytosine-5)-methyltransferase 1